MLPNEGVDAKEDQNILFSLTKRILTKRNWQQQKFKKLM